MDEKTKKKMEEDEKKIKKMALEMEAVEKEEEKKRARMIKEAQKPSVSSTSTVPKWVPLDMFIPGICFMLT